MSGPHWILVQPLLECETLKPEKKRFQWVIWNGAWDEGSNYINRDGHSNDRSSGAADLNPETGTYFPTLAEAIKLCEELDIPYDIEFKGWF